MAVREILSGVEKILCCMRYDTKLKSSAEFDKKKTHVLADGNITVPPKVSCFSKMLVQPNFTSEQANGVHDTYFRCFMKCDVDIRTVFVRHCRAVSLMAILQGTGKRIYREPKALAFVSMKVKVVAPPE